MSEEETSQNPIQMSLWEDFPASPTPRPAGNAPKVTPAISGRKCLGLSGNAGPLGLLEKTLLDSSSWASTEFSLTWKAKATPQGRLIFRLARSAHRTFGNGSGLLHTPAAQANQMSPSMVTRDAGSWGSTLWPTPTQDSATSPKKKYKQGGAPLTYAVKMWPTPDASQRGPRSVDLVENASSVRRRDSGQRRGIDLETSVKMWPTPTVQDSSNDGGPSQWRRNTPPLNVVVKDSPQVTGSLNPTWVAWLMGFPLEWLSSVPWATRSSRRSQPK